MSGSYLANTKRLKGKTYEEIYGVEQANEIKRKQGGHTPWNKGKTGIMVGEANPFYGKRHTEETRAKVRKARNSEEIAYKYKSEEFRLKNSLIHKGVPKTAEHKAKTISQWGNKEWRDRQVKLIMMGRRRKPNKPERAILSILDSHYPNEWKYVGDGELIIDGLCPDFVNVDGHKRIIECFGTYWHGDSNKKYRATEKGRKEAFARYGYSTLVIWENELEDVGQVIKKIADFVAV